MTHEHDTQSDRALRSHDRMKILASEYRQLGFVDLARWVDQQAEKALKWAAKAEVLKHGR